MRTIEYGTPTHVPAFLTKLWKLVTDESCDELISWSPVSVILQIIFFFLAFLIVRKIIKNSNILCQAPIELEQCQ